MFRAIGRKLQQKQNFQIKVQLVKVQCTVNIDCHLQVVWRRGPKVDLSEQVELNEIQIDSELSDTFNKVSSFYSKDGGNIYQPKLC
mmetsp:Transcript_16449/g.27915  ORF Transcript_16449/g.27915 Transcript_16449/m.27915 type:complete len:86 (+) Transcript_16449:28-285(+)